MLKVRRTRWNHCENADINALVGEYVVHDAFNRATMNLQAFDFGGKGNPRRM